MGKPTYVIGTGWWCDGTLGEGEPSDRVMISKDFFSTWYEHVIAYSDPRAIIVVDSKSPIKPLFTQYKDVQSISLTKNYPPFMKFREGKNPYGTFRTAATRQMYLGAFYAYFTGTDYFVWVEQDCLIHGKGIIDKAIENMQEATDISFGEFDDDLKVETSFIVMKAASIPKIFDAYLRVKNDRPELKYWKMTHNGFINHVWFPFGQGRNRPIKFEDQYYYAQQLTNEELARFKKELQ